MKKFLGIHPLRTVYAHCDIPCGIYDPHQAQVAALTVIRMTDLILELEDASGTVPTHNISRYTAVKEKHAELCKEEVRIIWGDYMKTEQLDEHEELNEIVHRIMQLASEARQRVEREVGVELLGAVNRFAEIFWETKGVKTKKVKAPYKPGEEIVYPEL